MKPSAPECYSTTGWEVKEPVRQVRRQPPEDTTVDLYIGERLVCTIKFPQWPPTYEDVDAWQREMLKHVKEREHGPS